MIKIDKHDQLERFYTRVVIEKNNVPLVLSQLSTMAHILDLYDYNECRHRSEVDRHQLPMMELGTCHDEYRLSFG